LRTCETAAAEMRASAAAAKTHAATHTAEVASRRAAAGMHATSCAAAEAADMPATAHATAHAAGVPATSRAAAEPATTTAALCERWRCKGKYRAKRTGDEAPNNFVVHLDSSVVETRRRIPSRQENNRRTQMIQ
jgi:hypothetical protein